MRNVSAFIAALLALATAGCVASGKAKTPATPVPVAAKPATPPAPPPPAQPLSIPQTQVELPREQTVDPAAYSLETPPAQPEVSEPAPGPRATNQRRPATQLPTTPVTQPPAAITTPTPAPEPQAPQIVEIVPPGEAQRLLQQAQSRRRDVQQIVDAVSRRSSLTAAQRNALSKINGFLTSSTDAEKRGDARLADANAERAQILAKELVNEK